MIGFVVGVVVGVLLTLLVVRRREGTARVEPAAPAIAPGPALAEPLPAQDDEVRQAIDATAGVLDDLETRYRNRKAPPEDEEGRPRRRRTKT